MSNTFDISKSLHPGQQLTLSSLAPFFPAYYLSGGTGLSFHLGHRISYDFDLFTEKPLPRLLIKEMTEKLEPREWIVQSGDELTFKDVRGVKITFLYYPYTRIRDSVWKHQAWVDSLEDIIANKLFTIGQRAQIRDYIDLYYVLSHDIYDIHGCVAFSTEKYGKAFDPALAVGQLCYCDDLDFGDAAFKLLGVSKDEFCGVLSSQARKVID
jgi:hypothetical protein